MRPIAAAVREVQSTGRLEEVRGPLTALINWHPPGIGIGGHWDDEELFGGGYKKMSVISIGLGSEAEFRLGRTGEIVARVIPGAILHMFGMPGRHAITGRQRIEGERISVTLRWAAKEEKKQELLAGWPQKLKDIRYNYSKKRITTNEEDKYRKKQEEQYQEMRIEGGCLIRALKEEIGTVVIH